MRKFIIITVFFLTCFGLQLTHAQDRFRDFDSYVFNHIKMPDTLKHDCTWRFAIISMSVDNNGKVIAYKLLNDSNVFFNRAFAPLTKYRFPKSTGIKNRPVVFYYTYDSSEICKNKDAAIDINRYYLAQEIWKYIGIFINKNRKTVVIPTTITIQYPGHRID